EERERVVHLVRHHLVCYAPEWSDAAVRRFVKRVGRERIADLLELAKADALGKGKPVDPELAGLVELRGRIDAMLAKGDAVTTKDLVVDGKDVMERLGIKPSRRVGEVLNALLEKVLDDPTLNERDTLLRLVDEAGP